MASNGAKCFLHGVIIRPFPNLTGCSIELEWKSGHV